MKMIRKALTKKALALILAASFLFVSQGMALAQGTASSLTKAPVKDETVYAKLNPDGTVSSIYVVNSFELAEPASFADYGDYKEVRNLTTSDALAATDGAVEIDAPKGRFYYQGTVDSIPLPWNIAIGYSLDGQAVTAEEVAGKSGRLVISLDMKDGTQSASQTTSHAGSQSAPKSGTDVESGSASWAFAENYMLQAVLTLDAAHCTGVKAEGATIVTAGKNQVVTFVKIPGVDGRYSVSMDVSDFRMDGIQITGIPFSMGFDLPALDELTGSFAELQAGIGQLVSGAAELAGGSNALRDAYDRLQQGLVEVQTGLKGLSDGISQLAANGASLRAGSRQVLDALTFMQSNLTTYAAAINGLGELAQGSAAVLEGLKQVSGGLDALSGSFAQADSGLRQQTGGAYSSLKQANEATIASLNQQIQALMADPVANAEQIRQLSTIVGLLTANNQLIAGLRIGIDGDGSAANPGLARGAAALATQYAKLDAAIQQMPTMLAEMSGGLAQLKSGVDQMVASYQAFDGGLEQYIAGIATINEGMLTLSNGYDTLVAGSKELQTGLAGLSQGMNAYASGTQAMRDGLTDAGLDKVNDLLETLTFDGGEARSFVSSKNKNVGSVQFIMMTDGIKAEEPPMEVKPQPVSKTFWQRLMDLFKR
jgi:putative membrane protein